MKIRWLKEPEEHDYPAALSYLSLLYNEQIAKECVEVLKKKEIVYFKSKDIFRASGLSLLGVSNSHVEEDRKKIKNKEELSPLLLIRDTNNGKVVIADGYHRLCALEHFETRLKEFKEEFLRKKKQEEEDYTNKGFTEIDYITIKFRSYPRIKIVKSTGIIDFQQYKSIKCSWDRPIEKSTADKLLKLKKRDLVLTDGDVNFICHKISKIDLQTNATSVRTSVCFGMVISFKNGEKVK